ncbi:MAG: hypothetical protein ACP6IP_00605 [Candidatus Njordarchaeia archaeon]
MSEEVIDNESSAVKEKPVVTKKGEKYIVSKEEKVEEISEEQLLEMLEEVRDIETFKILENEFIRMIIDEEKKLVRPYPRILERQWFYVKPHKNFQDSWYEKWSEVILTYCVSNRKFVVDVNELISIYPFVHKDSGLAIKKEDLQGALDVLVEKKMARWLDKDKNIAIVYWVSIKNILQKILKYSRELEFKYITLDLLDKIWPDLPLSEKVKVLNHLVAYKKAKWIIKNYAVKIVDGA